VISGVTTRVMFDMRLGPASPLLPGLVLSGYEGQKLNLGQECRMLARKAHTGKIWGRSSTVTGLKSAGQKEER